MREESARSERRQRHASIVDVAALAGVSPSTVSRSLRGHENVSPATRQRVADAARELAYTVSPHGSGLASGRTGTVGVVVPFVTRWYFANAVAGAHDALHAAGFDVLLYHLGDSPSRDRFFERMPLARRVDAVLTLSMPLTDAHTLALRALDMPLVTLGARLDGVSSVRIDDQAAARSAVHHLLHQGHEDIAMITAREDDPGFGFVAGADRLQGYRTAMAAAGLPEDVVTARTYGIEGGAEAMTRLMERGRLPSAVLAEYDEVAIGVLRTLRRSSVPVPARISVIGVDDHEMASVLDLTTVAQPVQEQGALAARLLLDQLDGQAEGPVDLVVPTTLVVRSSTGPPSQS
ncbi:LacI family DNA-binding transcriptional regulator [Pseudonocardia hydrocarbonoxydans]|uniref:Ribose operon repressor RbsR n=1 Tax=Pseudonocardia hydrocarbonoxydans TaxID=76726 RepID=A0A4Y3WW04_9PSEU|nr:LacI family DNA-binding transcriptional regulator [Pseudonocardia hydrocarbonoxydans]GEC22461.1 ribose operon repressor RbsR [Pseudonocardia hydrocarbonoxydans]